jgi:hypothetical protein
MHVGGHGRKLASGIKHRFAAQAEPWLLEPRDAFPSWQCRAAAPLRSRGREPKDLLSIAELGLAQPDRNKYSTPETDQPRKTPPPTPSNQH